MESRGDHIHTAVSSNNSGGDDIIEEANPDADDSPSIRNRIACKTGHILNNLTSSVWYSYALLYFQNVVGLSAITAGIVFFISQTLMAASFFVTTFGHDGRFWNSFSSYGRLKARHIVGSAGVLLAWPYTFTPCLFCADHSSDGELGAYYLPSVALFSICWPLAEVSYYSLMTEIRAENGKDSETSRLVIRFLALCWYIPLSVVHLPKEVKINGSHWLFDWLRSVQTHYKDVGTFSESVVRVCKVCMYILLWVLLQESIEDKVNANVSEQFTRFALILLPVGFLFVFAFHLLVLEPRPPADPSNGEKQDEEKNCGRSTADVSSPNTIVNQELTRIDRPKLAWFEWLKEPLLYKVGFVFLFSNIAMRIVQCYLPLYLIETLQLRKESVAFFPLIIVITRIVTEITCKSFTERLNPRIVILSTTSAIFGACMWFALQSGTSLVYVPTVIFACTTSLLALMTPRMLQELTGNDKEAVSFVSGTLECTEKVLLGGIVLAIQVCYPDNEERSIGDYLRVAFPAAFGTCIVIPMLIATAFMKSKDSSEGPVLTITAASPREENGPIVTSLPLVNNYAERLALSETSTPPVERRRGSDCAELQGTLSTAVQSDVEPEETQTRTRRDQEIEEVKRALDELHRLPSTDL